VEQTNTVNFTLAYSKRAGWLGNFLPVKLGHLIKIMYNYFATLYC